MSNTKPLIVFEGVEGSGKTTLVNFVVKYLKKHNINFIRLREPGGNKNSEKIRNLILNKKNKFNPFTDLLLYLAARSENIEKVISKHYKKKVILLDRFTDSTIAYQHYGMNLDRKLIDNVNKLLIKDIKPTIIFLNTVNLKKRLKIRKTKNRYDNFKMKFYKKVQNGFIKLAKNKSKYVIINSNESLKKNKLKVLDNIIKLMN